MSTQPRADGTYTFTGVAPGSYTVKAIVGAGGARGAPSNGPTQWAAAEVNVNGQDLDNDPALLEQLTRSAARVTLRDGETTTQGFRVGGL